MMTLTKVNLPGWEKKLIWFSGLRHGFHGYNLTLKIIIMGRQNKIQRIRKTENQRRDGAVNAVRTRDEKSPGSNQATRTPHEVVHMDRYRLNDLYERSSI